MAKRTPAPKTAKPKTAASKPKAKIAKPRTAAAKAKPAVKKTTIRAGKATAVKTRGTRKPAATPVVKRPRRAVASADALLRNFAISAARLANERHLSEVMLLDVRGLSQVTDYIVLATGVSNRQIKAIGEEVADLAEADGIIRLGREVDHNTRWYIIDLGAVMIHLFDGASRAHYDIESLWGDAPRIRWRKSAGKSDEE